MSDDAPEVVDQPALFEVEPDWKDAWRGMPEYSHEDLQPWQSVIVHFATQADRESFAKLVGQTLHAKTKFIWHPKAAIRKASDKVFTGGARVPPRHPVYIISKGRWESRLTSKALEWIGVPYHIVVEPQELEQYAAVIAREKILVTPFSNLGQGGIPARNFVWDHAVAAGAERHWILDDNISGFCRFQDNLKVEVDSSATFRAIEDFIDRYENVAMAAFNYDYFAPRKQGAKIKPITVNTRCYSGILLRNDLKGEEGTPLRWRGRYNEDTDLSLRILKDGLCTVLFNAFLMYKKPTLTMKGGNTDELYKGAEASAAEWALHTRECGVCGACLDGYNSRLIPCEAGQQILSKDGRWLMAESLREQHPDCVTVERKWERWQHQVDYRAFNQALGRNVLRLKPGIIITDNDYGMELDAMPTGWGAMGHDARNAAWGAQPKAVEPSLASQEKPSTQAAGQPAAAPGQTSAMDFILGRAQPVAAGPSSPPQAKVEAQAAHQELAMASPGQPAGIPEPDDREPEHAGPLTLKIDLEARGHRLLVRDEKFFVSEASRLTEDDRMYIKLYRDELIALSESMPGTQPAQTLAQFLGSEPSRVVVGWVPDEPPDLAGIDEIILNFATDGLDWAHGNRPVGVTVSTLDGQLTRFLPFGFRGGGNLDEEAVKRWFREQVRGKRIMNVNTRFEVHMSREWGVDLEEQGCTVSDVMHYAALLDDHRKRFALDALVGDYLPEEPKVERLDERDHAGKFYQYHASEGAAREKYTAQVTAKLRNVMWPLMDAEELQEVRQLEDDVIYPVCEMEKNGAPIDVELLEKYSAECTARHGELMIEIAEEAGFAFDGTTKAWQRLFERCGLVLGDSRAEDVIGAVDHPLVKKAHFAGQLASLNSKTFAAYRSKLDGDLLRFDINQLRGDDGGTVSGRFSIGYVQQVPNHDNHSAVFGDLWFPRRLFISRTGSYLEADAAQIEFRLFASDSGNQQLLQAYRDDPWTSYHQTTWAMIKRHKPDMLYVHQKSFNFARQYGAKMVKLAIMMGFITKRDGDEIKATKRWNDPRLAQIKEIEGAYKKINPEGDKLLDLAAHLAKPECDQWCKRGNALHRQHKHRGYIKTLSGRRSRFRSYDKHYIALNRRLQGGGADVMKKKIIEVHRERKHTGLLLRMTVHDQIGGDAQDDTKEKVSEILNRQSYPTKVPILWTVGVGRNWAEAK